MVKRSLPPSADETDEMEEAAAEMANSINFTACRKMGVQEPFLSEWAEGVSLIRAEGMEFVFLR